MLIGYGRVSTADQNLDLQRDALKAAGCERIFTDRMSGARSDRPELARALDFARAGDVVVVWKLDRLARSLKDLIALIEQMKVKGVGFRSLTESLDTGSAGGELVFHLFGALAQFERALIRERTQAGLEAARARGRKGGRKRALDEAQIKLAMRLMADKQNSVGEVCRLVGVSKPTLYRYVSPDGQRRQ